MLSKPFYDKTSSAKYLALTDVFAESLSKRLAEEGLTMQISPAIDGFNFHIGNEVYCLLNNGVEAMWQRVA